SRRRRGSARSRGARAKPAKLSVMDIEDFRRHAHAFVDWMTDYLAGIERYPVRAQVKPGEVAARLGLAPPERGEPMEKIFADFTSVVLPGITHWQHPSFFAYFPAETHSATEKGAKIAGLGKRNVRKIAVDDRFAMRPDALDAAIREDRAAGATPMCVVASLGTTGVGAMDPLRPIGEACRRHGVWLHVDAAWAGSALILSEHRGLLDGVEHVDSFVFNPHKWLFTNFDCAAHYVRDPDALVRTLEILPAFLKTR